MFQMDKLSFEREKIKVQEIANRSHNDVEMVNKFKREFEAEKEKNHLLKLELDKYAQGIQNEKIKLEEEKNSLSNMQKTLEGLRYNYVKEYSHTMERTGSQGNLIKNISKESYYGNFPGAAKKTGTQFYTQEDEKVDRPPKDPNFMAGTITGEKRMRATFQADARKKDDLNTSAEGKYILLKDAKRADVRTTVTEPDIRNAPASSKGFNLQNYMQQLKEYDKYTTGNQSYITMEKEGLLKNKLEIETGNIARMMRTGDKGSPRFKTALFTAGDNNL
jgi:hypothetical protein